MRLSGRIASQLMEDLNSSLTLLTPSPISGKIVFGRRSSVSQVWLLLGTWKKSNNRRRSCGDYVTYPPYCPNLSVYPKPAQISLLAECGGLDGLLLADCFSAARSMIGRTRRSRSSVIKGGLVRGPRQRDFERLLIDETGQAAASFPSIPLLGIWCGFDYQLFD